MSHVPVSALLELTGVASQKWLCDSAQETPTSKQTRELERETRTNTTSITTTTATAYLFFLLMGMAVMDSGMRSTVYLPLTTPTSGTPGIFRSLRLRSLSFVPTR